MKNKKHIFNSAEEAIVELKLDKRRRWYVWENELIYNFKYCAPNSCTGCDGGGCRECGGKGKRIQHVPIPAMNADGEHIKIIKDENNK